MSQPPCDHCPPWSMECYAIDDAFSVHAGAEVALATVAPDPPLIVRPLELADQRTGETISRIVVGIGREYTVLEREHVLDAVSTMLGALRPELGAPDQVARTPGTSSCARCAIQLPGDERARTLHTLWHDKIETRVAYALGLPLAHDSALYLDGQLVDVRP